MDSTGLEASAPRSQAANSPKGTATPSKRGAGRIRKWFRITLLAAIAAALLVIVIFESRRDVIYRYSPPNSQACLKQRDDLLLLMRKDNDERAALNSSGLDEADHPLTCMIQSHALKAGGNEVLESDQRGNPALLYYLSFLEFDEGGRPAHVRPDGSISGEHQLQELLNHLTKQTQQKRQNFVLTFIHGWRNDASIGNQNVAHLRTMAAHITSFLQQRCLDDSLKRYCDTTVTAVYVGWRGARINEPRLQSALGETIGGAIGSVVAGITLFDRKPVTEKIGPAVLSGLRKIDETLKASSKGRGDWYQRDRLLVVGHSLGGHLLAYGLKEDFVRIVEDHAKRSDDDRKGIHVVPPIGDLIVLLNPASEAENWTTLQRITRQRFSESNLHSAYDQRQPPIYIALTAAQSWPANRIQLSELSSMREFVRKRPRVKKADIDTWNDCEVIKTLYEEYKPAADYDWSTYDLFPAFKFDFRPLAQTIEDAANPDPYNCGIAKTNASKWIERLRLKWLTNGLAETLRYFPFMNTNVEQTRTIGHLDPMKSPYGFRYSGQYPPATWYGTTHELIMNYSQKEPTVYANAVTPRNSECATVDGWLHITRETRGVGRTKVNWDSGWSQFEKGKLKSTKYSNLTPIRPRPDNQKEHIESQFRQLLFFSGMTGISGVNDPFWNVRAYDSALANHNGYVSYPLLCTLFQFVMDRVAEPKN